MKLIKIIKKTFINSYVFLFDYVMFYRYNRKNSHLIKVNQIKDQISLKDLRKWKTKWSKLYKVSENDYLLYSHFIKEDRINIVPENLVHGCIEKILNPECYRYVYSDKNFYDSIYPTGILPRTVLRSMFNVNSIMDENYHAVTNIENLMNDYDKLIIKPSIDTCSGIGVELIEKIDDKFYIHSSKEILTLKWIMDNYKNGFIMQECIEQSSFVAQFNPSSVNTFRICVYKSVIDGKCHITAAALRIGYRGQIVDNAHRGGGFIGIDDQGILKDYVCNQYGEKFQEFNGINFSNNKYKVPFWNEIVDFSEKVASFMPHHNIYALDVMIDKDNKPRLIEVNVGGFASWFFMFAGFNCFGKYTNEIYNYCIEQKDNPIYKKFFIQ